MLVALGVPASAQLNPQQQRMTDCKRAGEGYDRRRASAVHEFLSKQQTSRRSQEAELRQRQALRQTLASPRTKSVTSRLNNSTLCIISPYSRARSLIRMIERLHYIAVTVLLILFDRPAALPGPKYRVRRYCRGCVELPRDLIRSACSAPDALQRVVERSQETRIAVRRHIGGDFHPFRVR